MFEPTINHVKIVVNDMDEEIRFFEEAFGLKVLRDSERGKFRLTWVGRSAWGSPSFIELHEDHDKSGGPVDIGNQKNHFAMTCENREEQKKFFEKHMEMGIVCDISPNGHFVRDPNGYFVELLSAESIKNMIDGVDNPHFLTEEEREDAMSKITVVHPV